MKEKLKVMKGSFCRVVRFKPRNGIEVKKEVAESKDLFSIFIRHLEGRRLERYLESGNDSLHEPGLRRRHQIPQMNLISDSGKELQ